MLWYSDADGRPKGARKDGENWTGEASRNGGLRVEEQRVDITIGDAVAKKEEVRKEVPIWMAKSTVINEAIADSNDSVSGPGMFPEEVLTATNPWDLLMALLIIILSLMTDGYSRAE